MHGVVLLKGQVHLPNPSVMFATQGTGFCVGPHTEGHLLGPARHIYPCFSGSLWIKKEIDKRQQWRGYRVNTEIPLVFVSYGLYIPQSRKEGEGKRLLVHDTKNKVTFLLPKTSSNLMLGQTILLVAIP